VSKTTSADPDRDYLWSELARVSGFFDGGATVGPSSTGAHEPALVTLRKTFRLSQFEHDIIVMCAGYILDAAFAAKLGGPPSFARALAKFPDAHLDATAPAAPLRLFRFVSVHPGESVLNAPLSLDERILYYVLGMGCSDERLQPYLLPNRSDAIPLSQTQQRVAARIAAAFGRAEPNTIFQVVGGHALTRLAVVNAGAKGRLLRIRASGLALPPAELEILQRTCEREMLLTDSVPVLELDAFDGPDVSRHARTFAIGLAGVVVISTPEPVAITQTNTALFEVPYTRADERREIWQASLSAHAASVGAHVDRVAYQFRLEAAEIADVVRASDPASVDEPLPDQLWQLCLERSRPRIEDLARRITPTATWDDLVLPAALHAMLREVVVQLRHRHAVHEQWGFARGDARGQAITALFAGPSGTGKTLAAEVIANETALDLYHVDLSQVVDKYVGETEKRLRRIFDAAEAGGAILLFDEADALFGKRAQVERGTDRWANIEVSYLLQRMESYNGLAILTTNAKDALDAAFLRRLRFVVQFPFPDVRLRTELWRRVIPPDAPRGALDVGKLARLQLTGANIKGIAINAAFHAASEQTPLTMQHLVRAARSEFAKLEMPFPEADVRTWEYGTRG